MTLDELLVEFGSDKGMHPEQGSRFGRYYERHFDPKPASLLELGVGTGASLRAWVDWGIERVAGVDLNRPDLFADLMLWQGDVTDRVLAESIPGPFDAIVDDASHDPIQVMQTYGLYRGKVRPGGWYVIEDTVNAGMLIYDRLVGDLQREVLAELHLYPDILFVRMLA